MSAENTLLLYFRYIWFIPLLPLIGALVFTVLQNQGSRRLLSWLAPIPVLLSFLISKFTFINFLRHNLKSSEHPVFHTPETWNWISLSSLKINFFLQFDSISGTMAVLVSGVSLIIIVYSIGYMRDDEDFTRFFALLNLFVGLMLWLILSGNLIMMFLGWEGVALCSWALIGYWYEDRSNVDAGNKAFLLNRIGDAAFLLGLFLLFWTQLENGISTPSFAFQDLSRKTVELKAIGNAKPLMGLSVPLLAGILFLLGASGKSAQVPLYLWLPDAMAGPTPVSALIHAATMVTAGVFLVLRLHALYELTQTGMTIIGFVGAITLLLGAVFACFENKFKRILAYSTISQIGYMFLAVGTGAYAAGFFHLITHAFFKALLFLGAGMVLHSCHGIKNIRELGGLRKKLPLTFWTFLIGCLALMGVPPFSGFWSKDEILVSAYQQNTVLWGAGVIGVFFTAFYVSRLLFLSFSGSYRGDEDVTSHERDLTMTVPMVLLAFFSIVAGVIGIPKFVGHSIGLSNWMHDLLVISEAPFSGAHKLASGTKLLLMGTSVGMVVLGLLSAGWMYYLKQRIPASTKNISGFTSSFRNALYLDTICYYGVVYPIRKFAVGLQNLVENSIVDRGIVEGSAYIARNLSQVYHRIQNGHISRYVFWLLLGTTFFLVLLS